MGQPSTNTGNTPRGTLAAAVLADLDENRPIDLELPGGGRLHIERRVPLICVTRQIDRDTNSEYSLDSEPAYLVIPNDSRPALLALKLLRVIARHLSQHFGGFLLIEHRPNTSPPAVDPPAADGHPAATAPLFEIIVPATRFPRATVETLSKALGRDALPYGGSRITLAPFEQLAPPGHSPLLRSAECRDWNCFIVTVIHRSVYLDHDGRVLPDALRQMSRTLHTALEQAAFTFLQQRKSLCPGHIHAPSRRSVVKSVLEIDRQLAEIDRSFDLLLQATPVNAEAAWHEFRRSRFDKPPVFYYRPLAIDPVLLKRKLYLIPVERIEDPTLSFLFHQKVDELDRRITLLSDVDTPRFLQESLQIYGGVSDWLLDHAEDVLELVPTHGVKEPKTDQLGATEFAKLAQEELGYYQQRRDDFAAKVSVRDDIYAGLMVSGDELLVGGRTRIPRRRVNALLQHEIGTHLVTRYNGQHQPFRQLEVGLAGYDGFQEGLAVLAEYLVGGLSRLRMRVLAARVVGARQMLGGASFIDTFRTLDRDYEFSQRTAYTIAMRLYRGGGLTKDAVYLRGLLQILRYLREGGDLEPLFVGKLASRHLPLIQELRMRDIIKPPTLRPRYLESPRARKKLERLRNGAKLLDLLQQHR